MSSNDRLREVDTLVGTVAHGYEGTGGRRGNQMGASDAMPPAAPGVERADRADGFRATLRRLSSAQKPPAKGSPAYSRFVNRKIGRVLAAASFQLGLTPNQVTAISAALSAVGIALVALVHPSLGLGLGVAAALLLGYAFDSADGQLARLRGGGSPAGEWLDHVVDSVKVSALHLAVVVGWFRFDDLADAWLLVPLGFALLSAVLFFVQILTDQLRRAHPTQAPSPAGSDWRSVVRSVAVWPVDYGVLCLVFALLGWQPGFVALYTAMFVGTTLFLMAALPKWFREVSRFTPERRLP